MYTNREECTKVHLVASMIKLEKKLKVIRLEEELTQEDFSQLIDISVHSVKSYESKRREVHSKNLLKIVNHPRFSKYTLWLLMDDFDEETNKKSGQVKPVHLEQILYTLGALS